ncbi:MAG: redoxin domain-containing protein [Pyrinomonadaceae bacterium]
MRSFLAPSACALAFLLFVCVASRAQEVSTSDQKSINAAQPKTASQVSSSADAAAMYEDASKYLERKFAEFNRAGTPYSPQLELTTRQQQRELAAAYAARLSARAKLKPEDYYFIGLLNQIAGKADAVAEPLRHFLAESAKRKDADALKLQNARRVVAEMAARAGQFDEAERLLADYAGSEPRNALDLFRLRVALAASYEHDKRFDQALPHERAAFEAAKAAETTSRDYVQRAQLINSAGVMLANLLLKSKRDAEALALMKELLNFGLTLPSAHVYANAVELLTGSGNAISVEQSIAESAAHTEVAPEVEVAKWIEQKPTTLAALRGQVVVLEFWATWCEPCQQTMPRLKLLQDKFRERGLVVVGLTELYGESGGKSVTREEELSEIAAFHKRLRLSYGVGVAATDATNLRYGVRALPTTFLIDRRGVVRYIDIGADEAGTTALEGVIESLLDEKTAVSDRKIVTSDK